MEFAVETHGLARDVRSRKRAVDGIDLRGPGRQLLRLPRAERRRQVDDDQVPDRAAAPVRRRHAHPRHRSAGRSGRASSGAIGVVPEDLALFDRLTAAETLDFVGAGARHAAETVQGALGRPARR